MHSKSGSRSEQGFDPSPPELLSRGTAEPEGGEWVPTARSWGTLLSCQLPVSHAFNKATAAATLPTWARPPGAPGPVGPPALSSPQLRVCQTLTPGTRRSRVLRAQPQPPGPPHTLPPPGHLRKARLHPCPWSGGWEPTTQRGRLPRVRIAGQGNALGPTCAWSPAPLPEHGQPQLPRARRGGTS